MTTIRSAPSRTPTTRRPGWSSWSPRCPSSETSPPIDEHEVPLYKRAQLLTADLAIAFDGQGPGSFHDLDRLTIFADNLVPHVLRVDGLLAYDDELLARIERGELIPAGSPEEIEIRAVAVHAVERIVAELRASGITGHRPGAGLPPLESGARRGVQGPPPAPNTHGVLLTGGKRQDQSQRRQKRAACRVWPEGSRCRLRLGRGRGRAATDDLLRIRSLTGGSRSSLSLVD